MKTNKGVTMYENMNELTAWNPRHKPFQTGEKLVVMDGEGLYFETGTVVESMEFEDTEFSTWVRSENGLEGLVKKTLLARLPSVNKRHDKHYTVSKIQPIDVMEQICQESTIDADKRMLLAMAVKYIMRAGLKAGEPWEKDIEKAKNYLHRALTGEWL